MNSANCCHPTRRLGVAACYDPVNEICCASGQSCSSNKCIHIPPDGQCCSVTNEVYRFCPNPHGRADLNRCNPDGTETCVTQQAADAGGSTTTTTEPNKKAILLGVLLSVGVAFCFLFIVACFRMRYLYASEAEVPHSHSEDEEAGKSDTELTTIQPPKYEELEVSISDAPPPFDSTTPPPPPYVPPQNSCSESQSDAHSEDHHGQDSTSDDHHDEQRCLVNQQ